MKRLRFFVPLLALLLVPPSWSAEPVPGSLVVPALTVAEKAAAQPITLSGPASLAVGVEGTWRLAGTPAVDLSKPLLDQLGWALGADRMFVYALAPGKPKLALDVRLELVIAAEGVTLQPVIRYMPTVKGEHRIVVDWNHGQDQLVDAIVQVGKGPDPPDPDPDPDPPLPPVSKWQVMFFHEADQLDNLPTAQVDILSGRVFREALEAKGHSFEGCYDVSAVAKTGRTCGPMGCVTPTAPDFAPWWAAVKGDPMPRIAIAPLSGGDVRDFPLPADAAAVFKLLESTK